MRSVLYRRHGLPSDVLETVKVDDPAAPPEGHVLVRVTLRPVHYGDLLGIYGRYNSSGASVPNGGNRVGFEGFGTVLAAGHDVDLAPGTRVAFFPGKGAWSEQALVPATYVTAIPDDVSDDVAAQLHVNPLTAALLWRAVARAGVRPGDDVVVLTAAGSAVAKLVSTVLQSAGFDVVGVVRSSAGAEALKSVIPNQTVVSTDAEDWKAQVVAAAAGKPIKAVLDPVAGAIASELASILANGGALVSYGDLSGDTINVPAMFFSSRNIQIFGVTVGSWGNLPEQQRREDLTLAIKLAREYPDRFPVAERYDLADVGVAAAHVERPGKDGVVLLTSS